MEQERDPRSRFALMSDENTDVDTGDLMPHANDDEEDENSRHFTELEKERCPNCYSSSLDPYTTKEGIIVLRCKGCEALLCPRCTNILPKYNALDGRKTLICPKCGILS